MSAQLLEDDDDDPSGKSRHQPRYAGHGDVVRIPASAYALFALVLIADLTWLIVMVIWAYERNINIPYRPIGCSDTTADDFATSGIIMWMILISSLMLLTGIILLMATHRLVIGGTRANYRGESTRQCEVCTTFLVFFGALLGVAWLDFLYIYMYVNCGQFLFCCTAPTLTSTCASADLRTEFLAQFWLAMIGTVLALVVTAWAIGLACEKPDRNPPSTLADPGF